MFRFEDPIYLYLLAVIPVLVIIRLLMVHQQKKRLRRFGDPALVRELMPNVSRFRPAVKFYLLLAALSLIIVMVARPQFGTKISHEKRTGIETIIAMDVSNSLGPFENDGRKPCRSFYQRQDWPYRLCWRRIYPVAHHQRLCQCQNVSEQHLAIDDCHTGH